MFRPVRQVAAPPTASFLPMVAMYIGGLSTAGVVRAVYRATAVVL